MGRLFSRREYGKVLGAGAALMAAKAAGVNAGAGEDEIKLAIDRSNVVWGDRPMYLRAYHPPYLVYYYAAMKENRVTSRASIVKWKPLVDRVENDPGLVVRIIEAYDDACAGCQHLRPDLLGSAWGVGYSCTTIKDPEIVRGVTLTCRRILGELGLYYGSEVSMRDLVSLLDRNVPVLYEYIGGESNQEYYEKGLKYLKAKYGL